MTQIIYSSVPFGFDEAILGGVLMDARRCNTRDGLSGALLCRRDVYLQFLEGSPTAVETAFARIRRDDRHLEVTMRASRSVPDRMFGTWAMLHDPAKSWMWSPAEISDGILDRASADDLWALFERLAVNSQTEGSD